MRRRTTPDVKATHVLHDRLFRVSSIEWLLWPCKELVEAMKDLWYLQDFDAFGITRSYGNFAWENNGETTDAEFITRLNKLNDALDVAEELIPWLAGAIKKFESHL